MDLVVSIFHKIYSIEIILINTKAKLFAEYAHLHPNGT